ncbi:ubiquinol-cytochrome C chaperone family protein [Ancylobacter sp. SL191]|uniref:ubiquinol-cytochrome C chaperone family protein n=1 Tax=Ancylobacter sp. SL191 TaxID=2995166 RepID=UPI00226F8653|nr:ubiquinol-cytochrome C chaperone family protein [Ancylobacter sp. SL191]WAC26459.1 ubiquinol-cytochrome C chaperone [Ancylobacter sp. SL191]
MILRFFRRNDGRETIQRLYGAIVAQSREPVFYTEYGVPDSIAGRFEMILLHSFLLFHRLKGESEERRALGQRVFDAFCIDMDANLREMGVGDLTVPKKMKKVAEAFYGRVAAYDGALGEAGAGALDEAVLRNVYQSDADFAPQAARLADFIRRAVAALATVPFETFAGGDFPLPPAVDPQSKELATP